MGPIFSMHGFLSLSWDEWLAIATIIAIVASTLHKVLSNVGKRVFAGINDQLKKLNELMDNFNKQQKLIEKRLEEGDKKFIVHDVTLDDHERRLCNLEGVKKHEHKDYK